MPIDETRNCANTNRGGPNAVAQLIGMDTLPPTIHVKECFNTKVDLNSAFQSFDRREHPQEAQLQKFKKEFEAWQESKLREFSSKLGHNSCEELKSEQILARESLNKEKMARYSTGARLMQKKHVEIEDYGSVNKLKITENQLHDGNFGKQLLPKTEDDLAISRELKANSFEPISIVILKPCSDMNDEIVEKDSSLEEFLEKVKERLRLEMEGKGRNYSIRSPHKSLTNPKQLALEAAKHGAMLRRSQSMITYRNAYHFDGQESSRYIKGEARKFISDRLKNVLKDDTEMKKHMLDDRNEKARSKAITAFDKEGKDASFWEDKKAVNESIPKHLRHEQMKMAIKAQIFQKHEISKKDSAVVQKRKKDGFSIKSTVSNLRRNLGLSANFFGKKVSSMGESTVGTVHYVKLNEAMPSNFDIVKDNSTEVPPSPASFPCSPINEHNSPVSPLEVSFVDDHSSTQGSGELSMTLPEFGSQTEHVESKRCEMSTQTQLYDSNETILIEGSGEAFVRNILVVSGLYRAFLPLDQAISSLDGQIKPISSCVFDEVEEKCRKLWNVNDDYSTVSLRDTDIDCKILFDLVNEALASVLDAPMNQLMSKRLTHSLTLLDYLLNQIQIYSNPKFDQTKSIDKMVAWDLKLMPWSAVSHEDIISLGREVEWVIMSELIDDLLPDLLF